MRKVKTEPAGNSPGTVRTPRTSDAQIAPTEKPRLELLPDYIGSLHAFLIRHTCQHSQPSPRKETR